MIITDLIKDQLLESAVMLGCGIAVMALHQIFRGTCRLINAAAPVLAASEVAFWIIAAFITYHFLYYCAYGKLSFHTALAFTGGALLWKVFFYDIIDWMYSWIYMKQGKCNKYGEKEKKQPIQRKQSGN